MPTGSELQDLANLRLAESKSLFAANQFDGCIYLCGYVVEMALKAAICKRLAIDIYPDLAAFKVHRFATLALFAGLQTEVSRFSGTQEENWVLLTEWDSNLRYAPRNSYNSPIAAEWLKALDNPIDGVLTWLRTKW